MRVKVIPDIRPLKSGMKQASMTVKGFSATIKSAAASMGLLFGGAAVLSGIKSAISTIANFEEQMSKVAAISRASATELKALTQNALDLGAKSKFTATQIGGMQEVMSRLGLSAPQIIGATDAIRKLATAAGEELAPSAEIAVKTMNAFKLTTEDMGLIANVMAESFSGSALNLERFGAAMGNVGATARAAGFSLEQTTAMLGILVDNGIEASKAGTDLRKIFTEISINGLTLEQALQKIVAAENKVTTSFDEFGQRAMTSGIILSENIDRLNEFIKSLSDTNIGLNDMVDTMEDNLNTDLLILKSAWDGVILSFKETEALRDATKWLTGLLNVVNDFFKEGNKLDEIKKAAEDVKVKIENTTDPIKLKAYNAEFEKLRNMYFQIQKFGSTPFIQGDFMDMPKQLGFNVLDEIMPAPRPAPRPAPSRKSVVPELLSGNNIFPELSEMKKSLESQREITQALKEYKGEVVEVSSAMNGFIFTQKGMRDELELFLLAFLDMGMVMEEFVEGTLSAFALGLGEALANDDPGAIGEALLGRMADFMATLGSQLIAVGVAKMAFDKIAVSGIGAVVAGTALLVAAGAVKATLASAPDVMSESSHVKGNRAADLNLQNQLHTPNGMGGGTYRFVVRGPDLVAALNNSGYENGRTGGQVIGG